MRIGFSAHTSSGILSWVILVAVGVVVGVGAVAALTWARFESPFECTGYRGEAHLKCLYAVIELQQERITKLEDDLKAAKGTVQHLQSQVNEQASTTASWQRQVEDRDKQVASLSQSPAAPCTGFSYGFGYPFGSPFLSSW